MSIKILTLLTILWGIVLVCSESIFAQNAKPNLIYFRVNVLDTNRENLPGLTKENFTIKEGQSKQEITYFSEKDEPASIIILVDISDPVKIGVRQYIADVITRFIVMSNYKNDYSLIAYGNDVYPLVDWGSSDEQIIKGINKIADLDIKGEKEKYLFKAFGVAFEKFKSSKFSKKILIVFSEGKSLEAPNEFKKVRELTKNSDVIVYPINFLSNQARFDSNWEEFENLAKISGGKLFAPEKIYFDELIKYIANLIKSQYVIGIKQTEESGKRKWQSVEISVNDLPNSKNKLNVNSIYTRTGYFK